MVIATIITVYNHGNSFRVSYFEKSSKQLIKQIEVKVAGDNTVNDSYFQAAIRALKDAEILNGNTMIIGMAYKVGVLQIKGEKEINKAKHRKMISGIKKQVEKLKMKIKFKHIEIDTLKKILIKYSSK